MPRLAASTYLSNCGFDLTRAFSYAVVTLQQVQKICKWKSANLQYFFLISLRKLHQTTAPSTT